VPAAATEPPTPPPPKVERVFSVRFAAPEQFLVAYRREMQNGGLFVPSEDLSQPRERIFVRIHFPGDVIPAVLLPAVVVQAYPPHLNHGVGGMAVEFENSTQASEKLTSAFTILRNSA
jgi:hypothetical protein